MSDLGLNSQVAGFESASELRTEHARLLDALDQQLGEDPSSTTEIAALSRLEPAIREFLERGAATGVYLDEVKERTACQILLDFWVSSLAQAAIGAPPARLAAFDGAMLPDLKDTRCPYVGLDAFRDREFFFGRESDTQVLLEQIRTTPLTVVLGASGSGKSSLVMGGVLPALTVAQSETEYRVASTFVPGTAPLARLAEAATQLSGSGLSNANDVEARLQANPESLVEIVDRPDAGPVVITIDQFEEVFTLAGVTHRETLEAAIVSLLQSDHGHRVILTMREEFRSRLVALRRLSPFLDRAWYSMRPMGYEELKAAIERPAALVNLQFQSGIVDDLVKKVLGQPAALPLLQFTLRTLWDRRDRNRITWEVYGKVGDPLTALKTSADTFYEGLAHETQAETRRILLELVRVDELLEAYRQPIPKSRLLEAGKANTEEVLRILTNNDYVRVSSERGGDDAVVEVKHESLIRNWPTLVAWIDEKRIERRQRIALTQASERWSRSGKPAAGLLTGWQLEEAKKQGDLSELEREFVEASAEQLEQLQRNREEALQQELVRERRRARIIRLYAVVTIVVLSILSGLMVYLFRRADNAAGVARIALAQASTQEAIRLAETGKSDEALAYIAQSLRSDPDSVAARSLVSDLLLNQRVWPAQSLSHNGEVLAVAFSSDGHRVVTASADKTARVWDTSTGQPVSVLLHEDGVKAAVFSPDGAHIVTASGTRAQLWSSTTGQLLATLKHDGVVNTATFSPDGRQVLTASSDSTAQVWNVATGARVGGALRHQDERDSAASADVLAASFSPDGRRVVTASNDATARIWNVGTDGATGRPVILRHGDKVNAAAFSPDGKLLVTACDDDLARVWSADAADAGKPPLLLRHSDRVLSAAFSSDGRSIVTSSSDGTARIWDSVSGAPIGAPLAHSNAVIAANFSPDGRRVVTASTDHTARMWNAETGAPLGTPMRHPKNVNAAAFAPDGSRLVTVSSDNTAQVWALTTGDTPVLSQHQGAVKAASFGSGHLVVIVSSDRALVVDTEIGKSVGPLRHDGLIYSAAFSTDGRYVVTASADTTARIWDVTSGALVGMPFVHDGGVTAAVFSSSGDQILTTSANNTARVWDAVTGEAVSPQLRHPGVFISSFSDDGRRVVTASNDNTTQVWDVATGQTVGEPVKSPGSIKAVTFDANAPRALIVSNVAVQIWDRATMEGTPLQKQEPVDTAAFSPDGRLIVTASQHTARVWDVATGQPVSGPLLHRGTIDEVAFSHDGSRVVVTSSDGTSLIWKVLLDLNSGESVQNLANLAELLGGFRVAPSGALVPLEEDVDGRTESNDMLRRFLDEH